MSRRCGSGDFGSTPIFGGTWELNAVLNSVCAAFIALEVAFAKIESVSVMMLMMRWLKCEWGMKMILSVRLFVFVFQKKYPADEQNEH